MSHGGHGGGGGGGGGGRASPDDFGRAVSNLAVAQLCQAAGFHSANDSALHALADVTIRYLVDLGKTAHFYSNLSGRSQCSVFDLILGLQDLEQQAPSQSQQHCLVGSSIVSDLVNYVNINNKDNSNLVDNEVPFSQPIPNFPVIRYRRIIPSFVQLGEAPPSKHIPNWLPALPDPHTYIHTPVWNERASDPREDKIEQARQRRKAERSLLSLQKRLLSSCNGSAETSVDKNSSIRVNVTQPPPESNKDVSPVALPSKVVSEEAVVDANRVSVLEAFAPAIEMLRDGGLFDDGPEGKTVLPAVRPTVHFKFRTGKKFIGESFDTRQQNKGALRTASLAGREDERDDKKRRAEYILKQSMENTQELTLL